MTNQKIERVKTKIDGTKARIAEYQAKLRDLERQKTDLENLEIIALYRRENFDDSDFAALMNSQRKFESADNSARITEEHIDEA